MSAPDTVSSTLASAIISPADVQAIRKAIDRDELIALVLELCNIPSPVRGEKRAGDFVYDWMQREGFAPRRVGMLAHRFNVVGHYGGHGDGPNLLFTSHLDTESPFYNEVDQHTLRPGTVEDRQWLEAWLDGETFIGHSVGNDRGPMVCFLLAAKALKKAGIALDGSMYLTACPGEIGPEPVEELTGIDHLGKELGAQYMLAHGGVAPDFAISAEGTDFGINWAACGYAYYKITLYGESMFSPILDHARSRRVNPILRMSRLLEVIQTWTEGYEVNYRYESAGGGTVIPKAQVSAIRGGNPQSVGAGSEVCSIYLDINLGPTQTIAAVDRELKSLLRAAGFADAVVEPYVVRHGFEADASTVEPLRHALDTAHRVVRGAPLQTGAAVYSSMWRDHNVFNMNRIPAVTMGPRRWQPQVDDLMQCTLLYALTALTLCRRKSDAG